MQNAKHRRVVSVLLGGGGTVFKKVKEPGTVAYALNSNTREAETGRQ